MSALVKICGINSASAAEAVLRAGAEFGGLMFFARSPRNISLEQGAVLAERMRGRLKLAAVVVDEDDATLARIAGEIRPDFFQLHGTETPARTADIRSRFKTPVIKVISVAEKNDLGQAAAYEPLAEMLMFDAKAPANATRPGGHGVAFDWQILKDIKLIGPGFWPEALIRKMLAAPLPSAARRWWTYSPVWKALPESSESLIADFVAAARQQVAA